MNIFARELVIVLGQHDKELSNLFGLRNERIQIPPSKVTRLKRSLSEDITATLNADELELLQEWVPLDEDGEDMRRLRAALVAEAVRHLLADRMEKTVASQLGDLTLALLLGQDSRRVIELRDELLEGLRGSHMPASAERGTLRGILDPNATSDAADEPLDPIAVVLEPATEAYEQGQLWLEVARDTDDRGTRLGYAALATSLLNRAQQLALDAPTIAVGSTQHTELRARIEAALQQAGLLR